MDTQFRHLEPSRDWVVSKMMISEKEGVGCLPFLLLQYPSVVSKPLYHVLRYS